MTRLFDRLFSSGRKMKMVSRRKIEQEKLKTKDWSGLWMEIAKDHPELADSVRDRDVTDWIVSYFNYNRWLWRNNAPLWMELYEGGYFSDTIMELTVPGSGYETFECLLNNVEESIQSNGSLECYDVAAHDLLNKQNRIMKAYGIEIPDDLKRRYRVVGKIRKEMKV